MHKVYHSRRTVTGYCQSGYCQYSLYIQLIKIWKFFARFTIVLKLPVADHVGHWLSRHMSWTDKCHVAAGAWVSCPHAAERLDACVRTNGRLICSELPWATLAPGWMPWYSTNALFSTPGKFVNQVTPPCFVVSRESGVMMTVHFDDGGWLRLWL